MRLYLSSFKIGNKPEELVRMAGPNKHVAVISNAIDFRVEPERRDRVQKEFADLVALGFIPEEIDLRKFFGKKDELAQTLKKFGLVWVRGGNVFILQRAAEESGFDLVIQDMLKDDLLVYGGYSAGILLLTPTLHGLELVDDSNVIPLGYHAPFKWEGLNLVGYSIAPHYKSEHPESEKIEDVIKYFKDKNLFYKTLKDGEVIVIEGNNEKILS